MNSLDHFRKNPAAGDRNQLHQHVNAFFAIDKPLKE
jgi:hypothetical protein